MSLAKFKVIVCDIQPQVIPLSITNWACYLIDKP